MKVYQAALTPELAAQLLTRNGRNYRQHVRAGRLPAMVDDMKAGRWSGNSTIQLDAEGNLLDGLHRCTAVIESGCTIPVIVIEGISAVDADNIDTGAGRSLRDLLRHHGEKSATALAAAIRVAMLWNPDDAKRPDLALHVSPRAAVEWLAGNPDIRDTLHGGAMVYNATRLMRSCVSAVLMHGRRYDDIAAELFVMGVAHGSAAPNEGPILLRRWALRRAADAGASAAGGGGSAGQVYVMAHVIKAWNMHVLGKTGTLLTWRAGQGEPFPVMARPGLADAHG
jgi:hypothetical protein